MNILIVLAGEIDVNITEVIKRKNIDYIVAVDGGYNHLLKEKINPNILIGDMDSIKEACNEKTIVLQKEKDYTDYEHALEYVYKNIEYGKIFVLGFISIKRPEHFYANLKNITKDIEYISKDTTIKMLLPGNYTIDKIKYISFFALEEVNGLNLKDFEYELNNYKLEVNDTLCISNEVKEKGFLSFKKGKLIIFLTKR